MLTTCHWGPSQHPAAHDRRGRERLWFPDGVRFPTRDRLAAQGMRFTNHHVHTCPCAPRVGRPSSPASTPPSAACSTTSTSRGNGRSTPPFRPMGHLLAAAGYRCAYVGKWHPGRVAARWHPGLRLRRLERARRSRCALSRSPLSTAGSLIGPPSGLIGTPATTDHGCWCAPSSIPRHHALPAVPQAQSARARSRLAPNFSGRPDHQPVTQRCWKATCDVTAGVVRNERAWRRLINAYVDLHAEVDRHLGTVLDSLVASGCQQNTLVVSTSDHGDMAGAHGLRQKAANLYRENIQVPLTMVWPERIAAGTLHRRGFLAHRSGAHSSLGRRCRFQPASRP